jgi:hypothetical protein
MPYISLASSKEQITQKEDEVPLLQGHSQGLNLFLAQLAGAYDTENKASKIHKYFT